MKTLLVYCHPLPNSYVAAVRDAAVAGLNAGGHEVRVRDLYADGFQPEMTAEERRTHRNPGAASDVAHLAEELHWCEQLVLVYPTWWSGLPAMLKGWVDRVWVSGVAWELPEGANRLRPRLKNVRRITVVTTHGSSKLINGIEGEGGKRTVTRSMRAMCHPLARTRWVALYGLDTKGDAERKAFLARVEQVLAR